jgi:hypothetical protein
MTDAYIRYWLVLDIKRTNADVRSRCKPVNVKNNVPVKSSEPTQPFYLLVAAKPVAAIRTMLGCKVPSFGVWPCGAWGETEK